MKRIETTSRHETPTNNFENQYRYLINRLKRMVKCSSIPILVYALITHALEQREKVDQKWKMAHQISITTAKLDSLWKSTSEDSTPNPKLQKEINELMEKLNRQLEHFETHYPPKK